MPLPPLSAVGVACTRCGFVGKALPNAADAKKELAQIGALLFGGVTAGALAYAASPYKEGGICPDCQVTGGIVPITSVLASPALEKHFGSGATVGDYLLHARGFLPLRFKGNTRSLTLTVHGISVHSRLAAFSSSPKLEFTYGQVADIALARPRILGPSSYSLRLVPNSPARVHPIKVFLGFDPHRLPFSAGFLKAAILCQDAFNAIKAVSDRRQVQSTR